MCSQTSSSPQKTSFRKARSMDIDALKLDLLESELISNPPEDLDSLVDCYNQCLGQLLDRHAPLSTKDVPVKDRCRWYYDLIRDAK